MIKHLITSFTINMNNEYSNRHSEEKTLKFKSIHWWTEMNQCERIRSILPT